MKFAILRCAILIFAILSLCAVGAVSAQTKRPKRKTPAPTAAAIEAKVIYEPDADLLREMREKVRVVKSKKDWAEFDRQSPIVNPAKTRTAYVARFKTKNETDELFDVIVVHDAGDDKFYEIRGIEDFPWRPLSDLKWISADVLQFEQWINLTNGGRYRVNLKAGKIVAAGFVRSN